MKRRFPSGLPLASDAALAIAVVVLVATLVGALVLQPLPAAPSDVPRPDAVLASAADAAMPHDSALSDVELTSDPFSPDRRLADDAAGDGPARRDTTPALTATTVRLLGTVVRGGSGFALCQLAGAVPRIVHVGEHLGDLTLISLEQGRAVFRTRNGTRLELSLFQPGT